MRQTVFISFDTVRHAPDTPITTESFILGALPKSELLRKLHMALLKVESSSTKNHIWVWTMRDGFFQSRERVIKKVWSGQADSNPAWCDTVFEDLKKITQMTSSIRWPDEKNQCWGWKSLFEKVIEQIIRQLGVTDEPGGLEETPKRFRRKISSWRRIRNYLRN